MIKMNFPGLVLTIGLLVAVELTVLSWARTNNEKPEIQGNDLNAKGRNQQQGQSRMTTDTPTDPPHIKDGNMCLTFFSVNKQPPTFPTGNTVAICQRDAKSTLLAEFATLFDTSLGIPRYSIYAVDPVKVKGIGTVGRSDNWHQTTGITLQGSNEMYANQPGPIKYQKGHVAPFNILSYSAGSGRASFAYTNAVPQVANYNMASWKKDEGHIVKYARECAFEDGTLYLITGISEVSISQAGFPVTVTATRQPMPQSFPSHVPSITQKIAIPNSMWTAGCCVNGTGEVLGAFAEIGNNLPKHDNQVYSLSVAKVQDFIREGANDTTIQFFPGNTGCEAIDKTVKLSR